MMKTKFNRTINKKKSLLIVAISAVAMIGNICSAASAPTEAPTGFDNKTNGLVDQNTFDIDRLNFEKVDKISDGLGPIYNATSCLVCHEAPASGSASQFGNIRYGYFDGTNFQAPSGGTMLQERAIDAAIQSQVPSQANVKVFRVSLNLLGDGYVEAIDDNTIIQIAAQQPLLSRNAINGQVIKVPVNEAPGTLRVGRFGWKNQHSSLVSNSAEAYRSEIGVTSPLFPTEPTSNGQSVAAYDTVADPEDDGGDIKAFAEFIRATKAPPRNAVLAATSASIAGEQTFQDIGCAACHIPTIVTAPVGTVINGGTFTVPDALGNKIIHPYSDFLLHDVGTGDGIVQNGGQATRNLVKTVPLWGLRTRTRLLHDGSAVTPMDAINSHKGEAAKVIYNFNSLSQADQNNLITFLNSL